MIANRSVLILFSIDRNIYCCLPCVYHFKKFEKNHHRQTIYYQNIPVLYWFFSNFSILIIAFFSTNWRKFSTKINLYCFAIHFIVGYMHKNANSGSRVCFPSPSGERSVRIREVEGSIPFKSTITRRYELFFVVRNVFALAIRIEHT